MGIAFDCGAGPATEGYTGFRYWVHPGPFAQFESGGVVVGGRWGQFVSEADKAYPDRGLELINFSFRLGLVLVRVHQCCILVPRY